MFGVRKRICVLASDIASNTVSRTIKGIMKKAYFYDYDVCVFAPLIKDGGKAEHQYGEKNIFRLPNMEQFAGVIVVAESIKIENAIEEIEQMLREKCSCPVVIMDHKSDYFDSIIMSEEETMECLVDHLIEDHGFTKINCLTGAEHDYHARERLQGYKNSLRKHGIPVEEERYTYSSYLLDSAVEQAYSIAHGLVEKPDAIVCYSDAVAVMMAKEFMIQGIDIPNEIAIIGFSSSEEGIRFIPCITSAIPPCGLHGENAVTLLHNKMEGTKEPIQTGVAGQLQIGQSCGCKNDLHYELRKLEQKLRMGSFSEHYFDSNFMEENLTNVTTLEDCLEEINWYTYQLNKFREFYICLIEDWDSFKKIEDHMHCGYNLADRKKNAAMTKEYLRDGYTEQMVLWTRNKNGNAKVGKECFPVVQMLPALYEEREYPTTYFFTPLHFKDRCLGYIAINFGKDIVTYDPYYHTWVRNINNAIEIIRNQSELRYINQRLNRLALYDEPTGVYNRFGIDQMSRSIIKHCKKTGKKLVVLEGDLDNLKTINDCFGHLEGDVAINTIANAFRSALGEHACIGRLGGDEFMALLCGEYDEVHMQQIKLRMRKYLEGFNETSGKPYIVDVSVGYYIGTITESQQTDREILDFFINNADKDMYHRKKKKKVRQVQPC